MQISTPIYKLKRKAKLSARASDAPLHEALDQVAREEGYRAWSHLAAAYQKRSPAIPLLK